MTTWAKLSNQEKAVQFNARGIERTARAELRTSCDLCDSAITEGNKYFDINGAKYAHNGCVASSSGTAAKERKLVTHKMVEEVAKKKTASLSAKPAKQGRKTKNVSSVKAATRKPAKLGRKPKAETLEVAQPTIKLSEVRESLPGAIVTLTITGSVEAVQRALDKLQN